MGALKILTTYLFSCALLWSQVYGACEVITGDKEADEKIKAIDRRLSVVNAELAEANNVRAKLDADKAKLEERVRLDSEGVGMGTSTPGQLENSRKRLERAKKNIEASQSRLETLSQEKQDLAREKNAISIEVYAGRFGSDFQYYDLLTSDFNEEEMENAVALEAKAIAVAGMELKCTVISDTVPASYDMFRAASHSFIAEEINNIAEFRLKAAQSQCDLTYKLSEAEKQYETLIRAHRQKQRQLATAEQKLANAQMANDLMNPVYQQALKELEAKLTRVAEAEAWVAEAEARVEMAKAMVEAAEERVAAAEEALEDAKKEMKKSSSTRVIAFIAMIAALVAAKAASGTPAAPALWAAFAIALIFFIMSFGQENEAKKNLEAAEKELADAQAALAEAEEELMMAEQELEEAYHELEMAKIHTHMECTRDPLGAESGFRQPIHYDKEIADSIMKVVRSTDSEETAKMVSADFVRMMEGKRSSRPYDSELPVLSKLEAALADFGMSLKKKTVKTVSLAADFFFPSAYADLDHVEECAQDKKTCDNGNEVSRSKRLNCHFPRCPIETPDDLEVEIETCDATPIRCVDGPTVTYIYPDPGASCFMASCPAAVIDENSHVVETTVTEGFAEDGNGTCNQSYNPVCARPAGTENEAGHRTYQNTCQARTKGAVIKYTGECIDNGIERAEDVKYAGDITRDLNLAVGSKSKKIFDEKKEYHIGRQVVEWEVPETRIEYMADVIFVFGQLAEVIMPDIVDKANVQVQELEALINQFDLQTKLVDDNGFNDEDIPGLCYKEENGDISLDPNCSCKASNNCNEIVNPGTIPPPEGPGAVPVSSGGFSNLVFSISNNLSSGNRKSAKADLEQLRASKAKSETNFKRFLGNASSAVRRAASNGRAKAEKRFETTFGDNTSSANKAAGSGKTSLGPGNGLFGGGGSGSFSASLRSGSRGTAGAGKGLATEVDSFSNSSSTLPPSGVLSGIGGATIRSGKSKKAKPERSLSSSEKTAGGKKKEAVFSKDRESSIFKMITKRYQSSAYPVLLHKN